MKVSILMLTYNAPRYVKKSIQTLKKNTEGIDYELIVVDNASEEKTKKLLNKLKEKGMIDKLVFNDKNELFAGGNNIAAKYADKDAKFYLLLNSDVKIKNKNWLKRLVDLHPGRGISSYGVVLSEPVRADGYCLLINKDLYDAHQLDEEFQWWWSVTKLEAEILNEGNKIIAVRNHENDIHHYGGKSGKGFKDASGLYPDMDKVKAWFKSGKVEILDTYE